MINDTINNIAQQIKHQERITFSQAIWLAENANIAQLGALAAQRNYDINKNYVYFNRNIHIEPTNICINHCLFCSYRRKKGETGSWEYSVEQMVDIARKAVEHDPDITEFHIVGGVHPERGLYFYADLLQTLRKQFPDVHLKAFTAEEIAQMCHLDKISFEEGIKILKNSGLNSMPGGGAEIFAPEIRRRICPDKIPGATWLKVHKTAHQNNIPTNATMLYGHLEKMEHRLQHLEKIRQLQDRTGMFNAFIPLKFKAQNNKLSYLGEVSLLEDLKTFALTRIFLDNIPHIKAYWPMLGISKTLLMLQFGVDDIDGTISDTTKIYSMAGGQEKPSMNSDQLVRLITDNQRIPVERDSTYHALKVYS